MELAAIIVGQVLGAFLWSFLNAKILIWRALKIKNWPIRFRDAYNVSLRASLIAIVSGDIAQILVFFTGGNSKNLLGYVGMLFGIVAWWFAHSQALLKLTPASITLTSKEARSISANVFAFLFGGLFLFGCAIALIVVIVMVLSPAPNLRTPPSLEFPR